MRQTLLIIILFIPAIFAQAQTNRSFNCLDESTHRTQFTIIPPDISEFLNDVSVTALGRGNFEPVIGITASDDLTDCYSYSPEAEFYELGLETGDIPSAFTNAAGVVYSFGENTIHIGSVDGDTGAVVVLLEAYIFETEHTYEFNLTEEMLDSGDNFNVHLVTVADDYEPSLTILDAEGTESLAEASEVGLFSIYGDATASISAPLPSIPGNVEISVNPNQPGFYALILELQSGDIKIGDGVADVSTSEEGAITLICDDATIFENGMQVFFPDDNTYTATALASSIDPVMAVIDDENTGFCFDDSVEALDYSIDFSLITIERDTVYPQANITAQDNSLILGGHDSAAGAYVLMIEGGNVSDSDDGDIFEITLTPQMLTASDALIAYVFTTEIGLDPILTWLPDNAEPVVCNDAGIPDLCDQDVEAFTDAFLTYRENFSLLGIDYNPMLEVPIDITSETDSIRLQVTAAEDSSGEYILVLYMVTD